MPGSREETQSGRPADTSFLGDERSAIIIRDIHNIRMDVTKGQLSPVVFFFVLLFIQTPFIDKRTNKLSAIAQKEKKSWVT